MTTLREQLIATCDRARVAARRLAPLEREPKDAALLKLADRIEAEAGPLIAVNAEDVAEAEAAELDESLVDRLVLDEKRIAGMVAAVREIASLDDPVGEVTGMTRRNNGMLVGQVRVPLGVIAMVYESRPNVTIDAAALCLKSGNATLLRGGKEAKRSNAALAQIAREAIADAGLPEDAVQNIEPMGRQETAIMLGLSGRIDLLIPRGGEGLIRFVAENARVPVVQHYKGVCHLFIDEGADLDMAARLVENSKLSRPGVCNALECLLVHRAEAEKFLPLIAPLSEKGLEFRGDDSSRAFIDATAAKDSDWGEEFLAKILALRVVDDLDGALAHIARYGSNHTEAICTKSYVRANRFQREVDASCVLVNASTRFNDGGMLGLGAEVGISTTKLHAYGPMGLASLTARKWVVHGDGQIRR